MSKIRLFRIWAGAKSRCNDPMNKDYSNYGGKGIKFTWGSFLSFNSDMGASYLTHVITHGDAETTLERVDLNKNYSKDNCRWATRKEQAMNRSNNVYISYRGKCLLVKEWAELLGISQYTLRNRIVRGMPLSRALSSVIYRKNKHVTYS